MSGTWFDRNYAIFNSSLGMEKFSHQLIFILATASLTAIANACIPVNLPLRFAGLTICGVTITFLSNIFVG